jgi:DNA-binding MarR family transcriptional regulator
VGASDGSGEVDRARQAAAVDLGDELPSAARPGGARAPLARMLLLASRWFDRQVLTALEARGWPRLSPAQSLLFAHLGDDVISPAELARRLGNTRQTTHGLIEGLQRLDLVGVHENPRRHGRTLVCITPRGRALATDAYRILAELEERLGTERVEALRRLLADIGADPAVGDDRGGAA